MKLFLISAWNDSGGGFLHRLLDGHPGLQVWPFELLLGRDGQAVDTYSEDWFRGRFRWPVLQPTLDAGEYGQAFDAIDDRELRSVLTNSKAGKHGDYDVAVDLSSWRRQVVDRCPRGACSQATFLETYISCFFELWKPHSRGPVLGHCPVIVLDWARIKLDFPGTKIVHIVRDPRSGFADMHRRHPDLTAEVYAQKWSAVNAHASDCALSSPDQVRLIHLERLLQDRQATMQAVCAWLGLDFDRQVTTATWDGHPLDEARMGPFGGVPKLSLARETELQASLDRQTAETLMSLTKAAGTKTFGLL